MNKVLSIDPSGTGTSGIFFANGTKQEFHQFQGREWKEHLEFIINLVKEKEPNLILYEDTNYIHKRTADALSLFRLLGAIEFLPVQQISSINVLKVKEMTKKLLKGEIKLTEIEYLLGRGKGWMFQGKRVSIHQLEAYLVYYLWKDKVSINVNNYSC